MEKIINYIKANYKSWLNWILRNIIPIIFLTTTIYFLSPSMDIIRTSLLIVFFEGVVLSICGLACYVYTKIDFVKAESYNVLAYIFLSVHIFAGLVILGTYLVQIQ